MRAGNVQHAGYQRDRDDLQQRTQKLVEEESMRQGRQLEQKKLVLEISAEERAGRDRRGADRQQLRDKAAAVKGKLLQRLVQSQVRGLPAWS